MTNRPFKTGESREQASLLPARVEDYVGPDNPVRAIESFVCALDLAKLGFRHADRGVEMGQPPYDPTDLLKLYLYGYINQIRSSRRLEREACRNLELIWLLKNLKPGYRTIANFRKENWAALKAANRSFVLLLRELGLIGGTLVAVDGALFHGNASKDSIFTRRKLAKQIATLDQEIEAYGKSLDANDAAEAKPRADGSRDGNKSGGGDVGDKMKELMARRERARANLKELESGDKGQVSKTDSDARLLSKGDQTIAGYNVQSAVDDKHKLIIASEVVNRSDAGHLHAMAKAAKEVLEAETLQILADAGYYNSEDLKACEDDGIEAYLPPHEGNGKLEARPLRPQGFQLRCRDQYLPLSGRPTAASDEEALDEPERPDREPLSGLQGELRRVCVKGILSLSRGKIPERQPLGTRRCSRSSSPKDGQRRRSQADAPPLRHRRASLRDAQMPRRLSALPRPRLRQSAWRMEPDGALLQLHPLAQHSRLRPLRRLHGRKGMCSLQKRICFRSARDSACFANIPD